MGLLDFDNADARLGLGLLAAASARPDGAGVGQRLAEAVGSVDQWKNQQMRDELMKMQIDAAKLAYQQNQQKFGMLQGILGKLQGGGQQQPAQLGQLGSGTYGIVPTAPGVPAIPTKSQGGGVVNNLSPDDLLGMQLMGIDALPLRKFAMEGVQEQPGTFRRLPDGSLKYVPDVKTGLNADANGNVSVLPGFISSQAAIEGGKADVQEATKAKYDPFTLTPKGAANPVLTNRLAAVTGTSLPASSATGSRFSQSDWNAENGNNGVSQNADTRAALVSEYNRLGPNHPDAPAIAREIAKLDATGSPTGVRQKGVGGIELQSEAEKVKTVKQAEADIKPTDARQNAIAAGNLMSRQIDKVLNSPGLSTGTGLSGTLDPRNYIPGTDATNFKAALEQVKGQTFLQAFESLKGGGQITEIEGKKATDAIARLNTAQSTEAFKEALGDLQSVVQDSLSRMRESAGRAGTPVNPANTGDSQKPQLTASLADIQATAKASGRTTAEVTAALKAKGYTIGGM